MAQKSSSFSPHSHAPIDDSRYNRPRAFDRRDLSHERNTSSNPEARFDKIKKIPAVVSQRVLGIVQYDRYVHVHSFTLNRFVRTRPARVEITAYYYYYDSVRCSFFYGRRGDFLYSENVFIDTVNYAAQQVVVLFVLRGRAFSYTRRHWQPVLFGNTPNTNTSAKGHTLETHGNCGRNDMDYWATGTRNGFRPLS